jgi:hypothetical protein
VLQLANLLPLDVTSAGRVPVGETAGCQPASRFMEGFDHPLTVAAVFPEAEAGGSCSVIR